VARLADFIRQLVSSKFYGTLTLKFESGRIVRIIREESIDARTFND
jgi:hypothetical protein